MDQSHLWKKHALRGLYSVSILALLWEGYAYGNPEGGRVVGGEARIESSGKKLDIHQSTDRAIIDWRRFDIGVDEHTQFHQPSSSSVVLNRVTGGDRSSILGKLSANGNVVLVNPNGILFGKGSRVDVNGLIATTSDIKNQDFMAGKLNFNKPGNPNASIINEGLITAKEAGLVSLVAPHVMNSGIIYARLGRVELASGDRFTIDLYGDGLYELAVSEEMVSQLVGNTGLITAEGGTIAITAAAVREIVDSLIRIEGELKAPTISQKDGVIKIRAGGSNGTQKRGLSQVITKDAKIVANKIEILGDEIEIKGKTQIDASGKVGGDIKIGGDYLGTGSTQRAKTTTIGKNTSIKNNASKGDAGKTIVWSDDTTRFDGKIEAKAAKGKGGFVETSGKKTLKVGDTARVDTRGQQNGTWLLDPQNFTIASSGGDISGATLTTNLGSGNVTILSSSGATSGDGDIIIDDTVSWSANTLTLTAARDILVNDIVTVTGTGALTMNTATTNGADTGVSGGHIKMALTPAGFTGRVDYDASGDLIINGNTYTIITSLGTEGSTTATDLQGMQGNLTGYYALGSDIDASSTSSWNGSQGFDAIGDNSTNFTGAFNGLGHTIDGLFINRSIENYQGLFGLTNGSDIRNVGMVNVNITAGSFVGGISGRSDNNTVFNNTYSTGVINAPNKAGGLLGELNGSLLSHSFSTAVVSGTNDIGGLVGVNDNSASITNSYATGAVSGTNDVGGLAGVNNSSATITNSYATGAVSGEWQVGGLVGVNDNSSITNSYATGAVSLSSGSDTRIGGFIGAYSSGTLTNNYWNTETSGQTNGVESGSQAGVTGLTTAQMQDSANFTGWDFTNDWEIISGLNSGFPMLRFFSENIPNDLTLTSAPTSYTLLARDNIYFDTDFAWADQNLLLEAGQNIYINGVLNPTGTASLTMNGDVQMGLSPSGFTGRVDYGASGDLTINGNIYTVITSLGAAGSTTTTDLQGMQGDLTGYYALGSDIDASATSGWNSGQGFDAIGDNSTNFTGTFNGLGHTIDGLFINRSGEFYQGLFGRTDVSDIRNVGMVNVNITGDNANGALVGYNNDLSIITNSYSTGVVNGDDYIGGLVGWMGNSSSIKNSYATSTVSGNERVGGLVGWSNSSSITNSYATSTVSGNERVGGLVGWSYNLSSITNSYATGAVSGNERLGGLVGLNSNSASISNSYATGAVSRISGSATTIGGFIGDYVSGTLTNNYWNTETSGQVNGVESGNQAGVTGLTTVQMQDSANFTGFDFAGTWEIINGYNNSFPVLTSFISDDITITESLHLYDLYARNNIYFDLGGNTLTLPDDVNLRAQAGNDISSLSNGTVTTNRTTTGGNITLITAGDINVTNNVTLNAQGGGDVLLSSDNSIIYKGNITTQGGDITLTSAMDGVDGAISLNSAILTSNGGDIILGGGYDPDGVGGSGCWDGADCIASFAKGVSGYDDGIYTIATNIYAGGGNLSLYGDSYTSSGAGVNLRHAGDNFTTSGAGNITFHGIGYDNGIELYQNKYLTTDSGSINLYGISNNGYGLASDSNANDRNPKITTDSGSINVYLLGETGGYDATVSGIGIDITSTSGDINFTALTNSGRAIDFGTQVTDPNRASITTAGNINISASSQSGTDIYGGVYIGGGNISIHADDYDILSGTSFQTDGTVTFAPYTPTNTVSSGYASGTAQTNFDTEILDALHADVTKIIIGASDGTSYDGAISIDPSYDWDGSGNIRALDILSDQGNVTLSSNDSIIFNNASAPLTITTQGGDITFTSAMDGVDGAIALTGAALTSNGGNITLGGGYDPDGVGGSGCWDGTDCSASFAKGTGSHGFGININNTDIISSTGDMNIYGYGAGGDEAVYIHTSSDINSTTGDINIIGLAGNLGIHDNIGVRNQSASISSAGGNITITGMGGASTGNHSSGILLVGVYVVSGTGDTNITLNGAGGAGLASSFGVDIQSHITTENGDITIIGIGNSQGSGNYNNGILVKHGDDILSTSGDITLSGVKGVGTSHALITTHAGTEIGGATATGNITFNIDDYSFSATPSIQTTGTVTFAPYTPTNSISAGFASGTAQTNFNTDILGYVHADVSKIVIGASDGTSYDGAISIDPSYDWDGSGNDRALDILSDQGNVVLSSNDSILFDNASAPLTITTQGGDITFTSAMDGVDGAIALTGATLTSNNGNITLGGGFDPDGVGGSGCWAGADCIAGFAKGVSGYDHGIALNNSNLTSGAGNIVLNGEGEDAGFHKYGIYTTAGSVISSLSGDITLYGLGGEGSNYNYGVHNLEEITSETGDILITGIGGDGTGHSNFGIFVQGDISSAGEGAGASTITLRGQAQGGSFSNIGIHISGSSTTIDSIDGDIELIGIGGSGVSNDDNHGFYFKHGADVISTGSANITFTALKGENISYGFHINDANTLIGGATATGNITFNIDDYSLAATPSIQTTGTVTFAPYTPTKTVSSGFASGTAQTNFDTDILDVVHADVSKIIIGASDGTSYDGAISIDPSYDWDGSGNVRALDILSDQGNVTLSSNDSIIFNNASAPLTITTQGGDITLTAAMDGVDGAIALTDATLISNGGDITIGGGFDPDGVGGTYAAEFAKGTSIYPRGILLNNSDLISSAGNIVLNGEGNDSGNSNYGAEISFGSNLSSTTGNIILNGNGGDGNDTNYGVYIVHSSSKLETGDGNITITGISLANVGNDNHGINIVNGADILSTGSGDITLSGIKGVGTSYGLSIAHAGTTIGGTSATGNITFNIDDYNFVNTPSFQTDGTVTFAPYTPTNTVSSGYASGTAQTNFNTDILNTIHADVSKIVIGASDGTSYDGDISIDPSYDWDGSGNVRALDILSDQGNVALSSNDSIIFNNASAPLTITTQGGDITLTSAMDGVDGAISLTGAALTSNGGDITLGGGFDPDGATGNDDCWDGADCSASFAKGTATYDDGITLDNSDLTSGAGNISLYGAALNADNISGKDGVFITNNSNIVSDSGNITAIGIGGNSDTENGYNDGIIFNMSTLTTNSGIIYLEGHAGDVNVASASQGPGSGSTGIEVVDSIIGSLGAGASLGSITINGVGADAGTTHLHGVSFGEAGDTTRVYSTDADIYINGIGGSPNGAHGFGVVIWSEAILETLGNDANAGNIIINVQGGNSGDNLTGLHYSGVGAEIKTLSGDISIFAIGGNSGAGNSININAALSIGSASTSGDITFHIDKFSIDPGASFQTDGMVTFAPYTPTNTVSAGFASGTAQTNFDTDILDVVHADVSKIVIGASDLTSYDGAISIDPSYDWDGSGNVRALDILSDQGNVTLSSNDSIVFDNASAPLTITTQGGDITLTSAMDGVDGAIALTGGSLNSNGGNITLGGGFDPDGVTGNDDCWADADCSASFAAGNATYNKGILIAGSTTLSSSAGDITLRGAGYQTSSTGHKDGIELLGTTQTTSGDILLYGIGGVSTDLTSRALDIRGTVQTDIGNITITGLGGVSDVSVSQGIFTWGGIIRRTSTTSGDITLQGRSGGATGAFIAGIHMANASVVENYGGNIYLTGVATAVTSSSHTTGISMGNASQIIAHNSTNIILDGTAQTGGSGNRYGIYLRDGDDIISTGSGNITIYGNGEDGGGGTTYGLRTDTTGTEIGGATATGNITFNIDDYSFAATPNIQTDGMVTFAPYTPTNTVSSGFASGTAQTNFDTDILDVVHADVSKIIIGASDGTSYDGAISIDPSYDWDGSGNVRALDILSDQGNVTLSSNDSIIFNNASAPLIITTQGGDIDLTATNNINIGANSVLTATGGTITFDNGVAGTITGDLAGTSIVAKQGAGTITLDGAKTYTGTTDVNAGTLVFTNQSASTVLDIASGAVLEWNTSGSLSNSASQTLQGAGTFRKAGGGTLRWNGSANFALGSGSLIDVQAGTLVLGSSANDIMSTNLSDLNVEASGYLWAEPILVNVNRLTGSGRIHAGWNNNPSSFGFVLGVDNGSSTFSGEIRDVLGSNAPTNIIKQGIGTITLSGTNTYTGYTRVEGGALALTGTHNLGSGTMDLEVQSGATYSGAGVITADSLSLSGTGTVNLTGNNLINTLGATTDIGDTTFHNAQNLALEALTLVNNTSLLLDVTGDLTLDGIVTASNNITLITDGDLVNNAGSNALSAGGRWLVYNGQSDNAAQTTGGLIGFNRYGCSYNAGAPSCAGGTDIPVSGNGFYYSHAPTLTITGLTANDKIYDGATAATLIGGAVSGAVNGDNVTVGSSYSANFADKNVGTGKAITVSGYTLTGTDLGYLLSQPTGVTGNITAKGLTITGLSADNKVYDALTTASLSGSGSLVGIEGSDNVSFNAGTASFADKNVGNNKTVTATGFGLTGTDAGNYTLTQPGTFLADITAKGLTITGLSADNKVYDALTTASLSGSGSLVGIEGSDNVSFNAGTASFADKNVGNNKTVTATGFGLTGTDAGNYTLTQPGTFLADITAKGLTITGLSADNKVYDALTAATLSGSGSLVGIEGSDNVSFNAGTASFADKNVGNNKTVTATGFGLTGTDAGNYTLTQPGTFLADITAKILPNTVTKTSQSENIAVSKIINLIRLDNIEELNKVDFDNILLFKNYFITTQSTLEKHSNDY